MGGTELLEPDTLVQMTGGLWVGTIGVIRSVVQRGDKNIYLVDVARLGGIAVNMGEAAEITMEQIEANQMPATYRDGSVAKVDSLLGPKRAALAHIQKQIAWLEAERELCNAGKEFTRFDAIRFGMVADCPDLGT